MDWLAFVSTMTKATAWPIVVLVLAWKFHGPISNLIGRVVRVSLGENSIDFTEELAETQTLIPAAQEPSRIERGPVSESEERIKEAAEADPTGTILRAWINVEKALKQVAEREGLPLREPPGRVVGSLLMRRKIDEQTYGVLKNLQQLRNAMVHGNLTQQPTGDEALQFTGLCIWVMEKLAAISSAPRDSVGAS